MIGRLRRRHVLFWRALGLLLPLGVVSAYVAIPDSPVGLPPGRAVRDAYPTPLVSLDRVGFRVRLLEREGDYQVEIVVKEPLNVPSLAVYAREAAPARGSLIGLLGTRGVYRFDVGKKRPHGITLHDPVHDAPVDVISLVEGEAE